MTRKTKDSKAPRVSSESVLESTGRGWDEWFDLLDDAGAAKWNHRETVKYLESAHPHLESSWWRQSITVAYEKARGKRVEGQTADAGFQVGVQRTVSSTAEATWQMIVSHPEIWLGEGASITIEAGARYEVPRRSDSPGARGEIRVVKPGERLRMTWQPDGWSAPATLQLTVMRKDSGRTAIHAHLEKLPDAKTREAMRVRWKEALERLATAIE